MPFITLKKEDVVPASYGTFVCPSCGSGSGPKRTGISAIPGTDLLHCFVCGDNFKISKNADFDKDIEFGKNACAKTQNNIQCAKMRNLSKEHLDGLNNWKPSSYLLKRGIPPVVQASYKMYERDGVVVIPLSDYSHLERSVSENEFVTKKRVGLMGLDFFGCDFLKDLSPNLPIFICEGEIDAASFASVTNIYNAVALCSTSRAGAFLEYLDANCELLNRKFCIAMDNDVTGQKAFNILKDGLLSRGASVSKFCYPGSDPNDALVNYKPQFFTAIINEQYGA